MYPRGGGGVPGPGPYSSPGSNYWPNWESHYAPVEKPRSRLHHRNNYAPPPYSTSMPPVAARDQYGDQYGSYQRSRRTLMDRIVPAIPPSLRRAEALLSMPLTNPMLVPRYQEPIYPIPLDVRCEVKSVEVDIVWDTPAFRLRELGNFRYFLELNGGDRQEKFELANWKTRLMLPVSPGTYYQVIVEAVTPDKFVVASGKASFKAVFNADELRSLYNMALSYLRPINEKSTNCGMQRFQVFYRNKPPTYFDHTRLNDHGIMIKYLKDENGHPASPINSQISGLFFNARQPGGHLPKTSPFGSVRFQLPAEYLLTPDRRLYFCDFYCNSVTHYVTVVACIADSPTDQYCRRWLLPLDPTSNRFISAYVNPYTGELEHWVNSSIWVEFYFTEDVPLSWGYFDSVHSTGQSKPNGLPNNKACTICNLYPIPAEVYPVSELPARSADRARAKRRASFENGNDAKRRATPSRDLLITASDFAKTPKTVRSTFHKLMEQERTKSKESGERLESTDPAVLEVVCYLVDEVSKEDSASNEEAKTDGGDSTSEHDEGYDSTATSMTSLLQRSTSGQGEPGSPSSPPLPDKELATKTDALASFNNGKDLVSKWVKNVEEMITDAKKMTADLCKKVLKLDQ